MSPNILAKDDVLIRYLRVCLFMQFIILSIPYTLPLKAFLTFVKEYFSGEIGILPAVWITPLISSYFNIKSLINFFTDTISAISIQQISTTHPLDFILSIILIWFDIYVESPALSYILFLLTKTNFTLFLKEIWFAIDKATPPNPPVIKIVSLS